jgi:hypothetical protein
MLSLAIHGQCFQAICWGHSQIIQSGSGVNHIELSACNRCDARPSTAFPFPKESSSAVVSEALDHV